MDSKILVLRPGFRFGTIANRDPDLIQTTSIEKIAVIEFNHGKVNAMDIEFCQHVNEQLENLKEISCRGIVLGTSGHVFSAGIDLKRWLNEGPGYVKPFLQELERLFANVFTFPKPVVTDISGAAIAGGCMVATATDFRVISEHVKMGILESRLGVPLPITAIEIMRHVASPSAFRRIISSGATYFGQQAVDNGLADMVANANDTRSMAVQMAMELAEIPSAAFELTKRQRTEPVLRIIQENRKNLSDEYFRIWCSEETRNAVRSYVEKRLN